MPINKIRNIAFVGQTGTGKTTLIEKLLFTCDATHHLGSVEKGDTVTDFDPQSIQYQHSIEATPVALRWNKHRDKTSYLAVRSAFFLPLKHPPLSSTLKHHLTKLPIAYSPLQKSSKNVR